MARGPVRLVNGDIRDTKLMTTLVQAADIVFHQAALRITHCVAEPRLAMAVMVQSTFDLLELCVKHNVEKVVAASSASVYGMAEEFPTLEGQHPYNNRTLYGAAKVFNEGLLRTFKICTGWTTWHSGTLMCTDRMDIHGRTPRCHPMDGNIELVRRRLFSGDRHTTDFVMRRRCPRQYIRRQAECATGCLTSRSVSNDPNTTRAILDQSHGSRRS